MKHSVYGASCQGSLNQQNEDSFFIDKDLNLSIVCDGNGELGRGLIAAQMTITFIKDFVFSFKKTIDDYNDNPSEKLKDQILEMLDTAIIKASFQIKKKKSSNDNIKSMGTTIALSLLIGDTVFFAYVGHSRIYLLRDNELNLLTQDQKMPLLGTMGSVKAELLCLEIADKDQYILCTDGLFKTTKIEKLSEVLLKSKDDDKAAPLLQYINKNHPQDNATAIVVSVHEEPGHVSSKLPPKLKFDTLKKISLFSLLNYNELAKVISNMQNKSFAKGEPIVTMGEKGEEFFIILSGSADVIIEEQIITTLKPGDYFGELSLIDKFPRSATVKATSEINAISMNKDRFYKILSSERNISIKLLWRFTKTLSSRLRKTDALIAQIGMEQINSYEQDEIEFEFDL